MKMDKVVIAGPAPLVIATPAPKKKKATPKKKVKK